MSKGEKLMDYSTLNENLSNLKVEYDEEGHYLTIFLSRPKVMNALTNKLLNEVLSVLLEAEKDRNVRCVVLRGTKEVVVKPAFSVGADLSPAGPTIQAMNVAEKEHFMLEKLRIYDRIEEFIKPMIAAVDGFALGGGLELSLTCDLVVASERSSFSFPEVKHGLYPTNGGTQRMARHIGLARTKKMILTGDFIDAKTMLEWGYLADLYTVEEFDQKVHELASKLGNGPTVALIYAKRSMNYGSQVPLPIGMQFESQGFGINSTSHDLEEGLKSFNEKRKPEFNGQ